MRSHRISRWFAALRCLCWAVCLLLWGVGQVWGHDFWLEPSHYQPAAQSSVSIRWRVGMKFQGKVYPRKHSRIKSFSLLTPGGKRRAISGKEKADPAGVTTLGKAGAYTLIYRSHRAYIKLAPKKFEGYLKHEGIGHIIQRRAARNERKKAGTEWYSRCAKALLQVGSRPLPQNAFSRPTGLDFELIPLTNPFHLAAHSPMLLRADYLGKPLAGQMITAYHRQGKVVTEVKGRTNAKGIVRLTLPKAGRWLVKSIYMFRTPKGSRADWESLWASLTFARQFPKATTRPTSQKASVPATRPAQRAAILKRVAAIHGAPGPFAVAGYLMGLYAQRHWKLRYGGWQLQVKHYTPAKVQWSCVADGIQAATGVSAGKLNLHMHFVTKANMRTEFTHKPTQKKLLLRLKPSFIRRYLNTPRAKLRQAGAQILALPFRAVFSVTQPSPKRAR